MPRKTKRIKKGAKVRPFKKDEVRLRREMQGQIKNVWEAIQREVLPVLKIWKGETSITDSAINDGFVDDVQRAIDRVAGDLIKLSPLQQAVGASFVQHSFKNHSERFIKQTERIGVDPSLKRIIKNEQIGGVLASTANQSIDLIKSVPDEYMDKVRSAIMRNYQTGEFSQKKGGLIGELRRLTSMAQNRAELIAVDQSHKLNASLNQIRSEELGSVSYLWRNSDDRRVRGNPNGKYPDVPKTRNHWDREGKEFLWKKWGGSEKNRPIGLNGKKIPDPPAEGNPGVPVRCRCHAEAVYRD